MAADVATERRSVLLEGWRIVLAGGPEARDFLHNLLTADVASLAPGESRRALLLTPTGRIRADLTVAAIDLGILLVQSPDQPDPIRDLLTPYLLSAEASLDDRSGDLRIVAHPGAPPPPARAGRTYAPSALGPGRDDVLEAGDPLPDVVPGGWETVDAERIASGRARFPVDLTGRSLPNEAGLDRLIDVEKGCFLGQEAVAKVRNLGHPAHLVLAATADGPVEAGEDVLVGEEPAGVVTGVAGLGEEVRAIIRIRWAAREAELRTPGGTRLEALGLAFGPA